MNRSKNRSVNKSSNLTNGSKKPLKEIQLEDILAIKDTNEKKQLFNQLIDHLLLNNCHTNKCHDLPKLLLELTKNLINFINFENTIDRLIAQFDWTRTEDNDVGNSFCQLICESINLKPFKCVQILENIIIPKFYGLPQFNNQNDITTQELVVYDKIHSLLSEIKIAKFESILLRSVEKKFPFGQKCLTHSYICYVYNMFEMYDYIVNKEKLLSHVFDKLFEIDLMLTPAKINAEQEMFNIDDCDQARSGPSIPKMAELLDHSIDIILKFIDKKTLNRTCEESSELFRLLESLFCKMILKAEKCYHLQYVLFYFCSISKLYCDQFIQTLWRISLNNEMALNTREKALYYISSLLKNGKFVTMGTVLSFMDMASRSIHSYIDSSDQLKNDLTSDDIIFYVLCQILFDIFCSTHTEFDNLSLRRVKVMNFQRIIKCNLNPLSFCSRDIEMKFLCLARHYQIGYCSQNLKRDDERFNKLPIDHLNSFDGFGSYFLPKSYQKIEQICKHAVNGENNVINDSFNRYNSDESDNMIGSYKLSYSPSKTLLYNLLSDSSPNELMDFE